VQKPGSSIEISENHRRAISAILAMLDQALCQFKRWAEGYEAHSVLYSERNTLAPRQRQEILRVVQDTQGLIERLRDDLSLQRDVLITANAIRGHCSILWESLEEIQTRYLRGYGEPPPGLAAYLDPKVAQLIGYIRKLSTIAAD
jgi:hypothetical protein